VEAIMVAHRLLLLSDMMSQRTTCQCRWMIPSLFSAVASLQPRTVNLHVNVIVARNHEQLDTIHQQLMQRNA
jgi:hypothetical protein